jgi:hypothetical protein
MGLDAQKQELRPITFKNTCFFFRFMIRKLGPEVAVYHFTTGPNEAQIKEEGLQPRSKMVVASLADYLTDSSAQLLPQRAYQEVWYGILPADLDSWKNSPEYPGVWGSMMERILAKERLRTVHVFKMQAMADPDTLEVFDFAPLARVMRAPDSDRKSMIDEAVRQYWDSGRPLTGYFGGYALPETVSWSPVGRDNLFTKSKVTYAPGQRQVQPVQN